MTAEHRADQLGEGLSGLLMTVQWQLHCTACPQEFFVHHEVRANLLYNCAVLLPQPKLGLGEAAVLADAHVRLVVLHSSERWETLFDGVTPGK